MHAKALPTSIDIKPVSVEVPGRLVFRAVHPGRPEGTNYWAGVVSDAGVELDVQAALTDVFQAWGYGQTRTVPAEDVAHVATYLWPGLHEEPSPLLSEETRSLMRQTVRDRVAVPLEVTHDGAPAVRFWFGTAGEPMRCATVVAHPDGTAGVVAVCVD